MLSIVQLLIFSCILLILDTELCITARAALAILVLLTPSVLSSFSGLNYPERNVLFFFACLVLSVKRFEQTQAIAWAVAAAVSAQIMIYYKETAGLLLLGFAAGRLICAVETNTMQDGITIEFGIRKAVLTYASLL